MKYLTAEDILFLHYKAIEDFGGSHGIRDQGRIISVVAAPQQEVFGEQQYKTIYEKAAVYTRSIIGDHPFSDGNKRTAIIAAGVFLIQNKQMIVSPKKELEDFAVRVSTDKLSVEEIAVWLKNNTKKDE